MTLTKWLIFLTNITVGDITCQEALIRQKQSLGHKLVCDCLPYNDAPRNTVRELYTRPTSVLSAMPWNPNRFYTSWRKFLKKQISPPDKKVDNVENAWLYDKSNFVDTRNAKKTLQYTWN